MAQPFTTVLGHYTPNVTTPNRGLRYGEIFAAGRADIRKQAMAQADQEAAEITLRNEQQQAEYMARLKAAQERRDAIDTQIRELRELELTSDMEARKRMVELRATHAQDTADAHNTARKTYAQGLQSERAARAGRSVTNINIGSDVTDTLVGAPTGEDLASKGVKELDPTKDAINERVMQDVNQALDQYEAGGGEPPNIEQIVADSAAQWGVVDKNKLGLQVGAQVRNRYIEKARGMVDQWAAEQGREVTAAEYDAQMRDATSYLAQQAGPEIASYMEARTPSFPTEAPAGSGQEEPARGVGYTPVEAPAPGPLSGIDAESEIQRLMAERDAIADPEAPQFQTYDRVQGFRNARQRGWGTYMNPSDRDPTQSAVGTMQTPQPSLAQRLRGEMDQLIAQGATEDEARNLVVSRQLGRAPQAAPLAPAGSSPTAPAPAEAPVPVAAPPVMPDVVQVAPQDVQAPRLATATAGPQVDPATGRPRRAAPVEQPMVEQPGGAEPLPYYVAAPEPDPLMEQVFGGGGGGGAPEPKSRSQIDRETRVRAIPAGVSMAKKPKKLRRLLANDSVGKKVNQVYRQMLGPDGRFRGSPEKLQELIVQLVPAADHERALTMAVAKFLDDKHTRQAGVSQEE